MWCWVCVVWLWNTHPSMCGRWQETHPLSALARDAPLRIWALARDAPLSRDNHKSEEEGMTSRYGAPPPLGQEEGRTQTMPTSQVRI